MDQDDEMHLDERGPRDRPKWNNAKGDYAAKNIENASQFCKIFIDTNKKLYSQNEVDAYRSKYEVIIKNGTDQQPLLYWEDCEFPRDLMTAIKKQQFKQPTPIQAQVFPLVMAGKDVIGIAQTGSGKTIGYLFPGIIHILDQPKPLRGEGPIALILAPTRELCVQIEEQVKTFAYPCGMNSACVYGGNMNRRNQMNSLDRFPEIIVACPGRLLDFLNNEKTNLERVTYLVIDEADRLLDMGFEPQVRDIVSRIRMERQTVFFSATWPKEVQQLARDFCQNDPVYIQIGKHNLTINKDIEQDVVCLYGNQKLQKLMQILDDMLAFDKVLIFAETKLSCEQLSRDLTREGYYCESLHGDKSQDQRDKVMTSFKSSETRLVCATDLASRGLDVKDITVVINYDFPRQFDDYIHRIGRTGRAGQKGKSFSFLSYDRDDVRIAKQLIKILHEAGQPVRKELEDFANHYFPAKSLNGQYKPNNHQEKHSFKPTQAQNDKEFYLNQKQSNYGGDYNQPSRGYNDYRGGRSGDYNRGNDNRNNRPSYDQGGYNRNDRNDISDRGNNYNNNNRGFDNDRGNNRRGYDTSNRGTYNRDDDWRNNDRGSSGYSGQQNGFRGRNDDNGQNNRFSDRQNDAREGGQNNRFNDRDINSREGQNDRFNDRQNDSSRGGGQNDRFNDRESNSRGGQNDRFSDRQNDAYRGGGQNNRFNDRESNYRGGQNDFQRGEGQNNRFNDGQNDGYRRQNDNYRGSQNDNYRGSQNDGYRGGQNDRFNDRGNNQGGRGQNERYTDRNNIGEENQNNRFGGDRSDDRNKRFSERQNDQSGNDRMNNNRNNDRGNRDQQDGRGNNSRFQDRGDNQRFQNRIDQSDNNNNDRNYGHQRNNNERFQEQRKEIDNKIEQNQQDREVEVTNLQEEQFYKPQFQSIQLDDQIVQTKSRDPSPQQKQ